MNVRALPCTTKGELPRRKTKSRCLIITLPVLTKHMLTGAASPRFHEAKGFPGKYLRLQILTIAELLEAKKIQYPEHRVETIAKAKRKSKVQQEGLFST
jgi:hypothetical protein